LPEGGHFPIFQKVGRPAPFWKVSGHVTPQAHLWRAQRLVERRGLPLKRAPLEGVISNDPLPSGSPAYSGRASPPPTPFPQGATRGHGRASTRHPRSRVDGWPSGSRGVFWLPGLLWKGVAKTDTLSPGGSGGPVFSGRCRSSSPQTLHGERRNRRELWTRNLLVMNSRAFFLEGILCGCCGFGGMLPYLSKALQKLKNPEALELPTASLYRNTPGVPLLKRPPRQVCCRVHNAIEEYGK